jgi:cobalt/nickel transport system permease protein
MSGAHDLGAIGLAGDPASPVHRLDPRAKVIGLAAVTLVAVSTPLRAWPAFAACALALVAVAALARIGPATILRRARVVLPLILFVAAFVPFARAGGARLELGPLTVSEAGLGIFATVAAKAAIGTASAVLLGATTSFPDVLHALERLRAPRLLVLIAGFMYRYLFVVAGEVSRMRAALAARGYRPRHALQAGALGRAATALFLRTHSRAERVHLAMLARGSGGAMRRLDVLALTRADAVFVAAIAVALVPARVLSEGLL